MKSKAITLLLAVSVLTLLGLGSCKKERSMDALIIVKKHTDTSVVIPFAEVRLTVPINANPGTDIDDIVGYTDLNGEFRQTFDLPVQLNIFVTKDSLKGIGVLTLNDPGESFTKRVYVY